MADGAWPPRPSPVLLVQQRHEPREPPDDDRKPGRRRWMHQPGLAQVVSDLGENIKQKAGRDATQNHLLHAAEPEETQRNSRGQQHHRGEYKWARDELLVL